MTAMLYAAFPLMLLIASPGLARDRVPDPEAGREVFGQCAGCHEVGEGAVHRIGPHLNGIFGRRAASHAGFDYSESLERLGKSGLEWHADTLDTYIEDPRALASGTRMSFRGLKAPQERADLLAYLRQFSASPADIPEADPTATRTDHDLDPEILALEGDPEYGAYLASECTTCHQADGGNQGIPSIVYWPEEDFVIAMHAYKTRKRANPVMQMVAGRLGDEEIAALAAYFANIEQ
jgi:cytochrome c